MTNTMKGGRTFSIALSVRGAIRDLEGRRPRAKSYFNDKNTGKSLTNAAALSGLRADLAAGRELLPMGDECGTPCGHADKGCTGFNYKEGGGCPGYPTPAKDDTQ